MCHGHTATHSLTHSRDRFEDEERERPDVMTSHQCSLSLSLSLSHCSGGSLELYRFIGSYIRPTSCGITGYAAQHILSQSVPDL